MSTRNPHHTRRDSEHDAYIRSVVARMSPSELVIWWGMGGQMTEAQAQMARNWVQAEMGDELLSGGVFNTRPDGGKDPEIPEPKPVERVVPEALRVRGAA